MTDGIEAFRKLSRENEHGDGYDVVCVNVSHEFDLLAARECSLWSGSIPIVAVVRGMEPVHAQPYLYRGVSDVLLNPGPGELETTVNKYLQHLKLSQAAMIKENEECAEYMEKISFPKVERYRLFPRGCWRNYEFDDAGLDGVPKQGGSPSGLVERTVDH